MSNKQCLKMVDSDLKARYKAVPCSIQKHQIRGAIIRLVAIPVMNVFCRLQRSPQLGRHNEAVLERHSAFGAHDDVRMVVGDMDQDVTPPCYVTPALPGRMTSAAPANLRTAVTAGASLSCPAERASVNAPPHHSAGATSHLDGKTRTPCSAKRAMTDSAPQYYASTYDLFFIPMSSTHSGERVGAAQGHRARPRATEHVPLTLKHMEHLAAYTAGVRRVKVGTLASGGTETPPRSRSKQVALRNKQRPTIATLVTDIGVRFTAGHRAKPRDGALNAGDDERYTAVLTGALCHNHNYIKRISWPQQL